ncbi:MAG: hypothetical protein WEB90_05925 [Gemmatimonadota bacterium]
MIYLATGLFLWFVRALVPTSFVLVLGGVGAWLAHRFGGLPVRTGVIGVAVVALGVLGWQTRSVRREFTHPEITMFRRYIADPIPDEVRNLAPGSGSPLVMSNSAIVRFEAPTATLDALLNHSLPGSTALEVLAELKTRNGRDTVSTSRVAAGGGRAYARMDTTALPTGMQEAFPGAHARVLQEARRGLEVYALAETGEWGRFESVVTYDRPAERVHVQQLVVRAAVPGS